MSDVPTQITALLHAIGDGDAGAADQLIRLVYDELHRVAHAMIAREDRRSDLQTTVVVHEVCLRLLGGDAAIQPQNRRQLFGFAAKAMRQLLVDNARKRDRLKRGGGRAPGELIEEPALLDRNPRTAQRAGRLPSPVGRTAVLRRPDGRRSGGGSRLLASTGG